MSPTTGTKVPRAMKDAVECPGGGARVPTVATLAVTELDRLFDGEGGPNRRDGAP